MRLHVCSVLWLCKEGKSGALVLGHGLGCEVKVDEMTGLDEKRLGYVV